MYFLLIQQAITDTKYTHLLSSPSQAKTKEKVTGEGWLGNCCLGTFCPLYWCILSGPDLRRQIRQKYNLAEQPCGDVCIFLSCCCVCATCQEARELKARGLTHYKPQPAPTASAPSISALVNPPLHH